MDFQSAMETFAEAWVAANAAVKADAPSDLSQTQGLSLEAQRCRTPSTRRQSPASDEHRAPRPRSPPHPPRAPRTPADHEPRLSPKKENFNNLVNSSASAKSLPVHCVVECVNSLEESCWRRRSAVETDSYVIIPATTAFHELVAAALMRLGYPRELSALAKGSVVINNWKPLPFEKISDGPLATVGEILGELTTVATLRIQVFRPRMSGLQDVKDKLLRLFMAHSRGLLISTGCPLDEMTLAQLCRSGAHALGPHFPDIPEDTRRKFEAWWSAQVSPRPAPFSPRRPPSPPLKTTRSPGSGIPEHVHPALQTVQNQYPTQKTRMRTSFDPELELPKLQRWFSENQHPSRQQIQQYVRELNSLESRRGRKPLDVNNVVYWFKNARAAQKRAEQRNIGGVPCHMSMNGFTSRSHSPTNGSIIMANDYLSLEHNSMKSPTEESPSRGYSLSVVSEDNMSAAGSDLEDEVVDPDDRPDSPEPLSLITHKKTRDNDESHRESPKPPDIIKVHDIKLEPRDLSKTEDRDQSPHNSPAKNSDSSSHNNNNSTPNNNNNEEENGVTVDDNISDDDSEEVSNSLELRRRNADLSHYRPNSPHAPIDRLHFPMVANPMFGHSIMYMNPYIPSLAGIGGVGASDSAGASGLNLALAGSSDERRKRNRTFIDPVSEVPVLEQWFSMNTHPSHNLIIKYTEELNRMAYRQKFPRLESKNVQFWFKNRRAKCKRLKMSLYEPPSPNSLAHYHPGERKLT